MRAILYTHDMEPITALTIEGWMGEYLEKNGQVNLAVLETPRFNAAPPDATVPQPLCRTVCITAEVFRYRGQRHLMLFTRDEESAMLLRSVFLPGQRLALREAEDKAMAEGMLRGLTVALRGFKED